MNPETAVETHPAVTCAFVIVRDGKLLLRPNNRPEMPRGQLTLEHIRRVVGIIRSRPRVLKETVRILASADLIEAFREQANQNFPNNPRGFLRDLIDLHPDRRLRFIIEFCPYRLMIYQGQWTLIMPHIKQASTYGVVNVQNPAWSCAKAEAVIVEWSHRDDFKNHALIMINDPNPPAEGYGSELVMPKAWKKRDRRFRRELQRDMWAELKELIHASE